MIILGVVIVLVILLLANVALSVFNQMFPPCMSVGDYYDAAKRLPSDRVSTLSTSTLKPRSAFEMDQVVDDDKLVSDGIGRHSRAEIDSLKEGMSDGMNHNINGNINESDYGATFKDALKDVYSDGTKKEVTDFNGTNLAIFEKEMEGIQANVGFVNAYGARAPPSKFTNAIDRDGYSERMTM